MHTSVYNYIYIYIDVTCTRPRVRLLEFLEADPYTLHVARTQVQKSRELLEGLDARSIWIDGDNDWTNLG